MKWLWRIMIICFMAMFGMIALLFLTSAWTMASPTSMRTLILTNKTRLETLYGAPTVNTLLTQLNQFAAHSAVNGTVIFVEETPAIADAYAAWQTDPTNSTKANNVTDAIHALIVEKANANADLQYIVLVGDDRVLPQRRVADDTPQSNEKTYNEVPTTTTVGAALANNMFLTDDFYGDLQLKTAPSLYLPSLAVGRLVETPSEMGAALTQFLATGGQIRATDALVANSIDFTRDAAQSNCTTFANPSNLITLTSDCTFVDNSWAAADLDNKLRNSNAGLLFLYGNTNHWSLKTLTSTVTSNLVNTWNSPANGRLVFSIGAHAGLHVPPETTQPFDWPQAWLAKGAVYVANTGFHWGLLNGIGLSEKLGGLFAQNLVGNPMVAGVGRALIAAKQTYITQASNLTSYDKKVVNEMILYGLPMYQMQPPTGALIVVPGRFRENDLLQPNVHHASNAVYQRFYTNGYNHQQIYYLATTLLDATGDGIPDVDATATLTNLQTAITQWAVNKVGSGRYLTLYLVGSGGTEQFYIDKVNQQVLTPALLNQWLQQLETAVPGVKINIIIDQGMAGSFMDLPETVSKPGRLLITSSAPQQVAYASKDGAVFSDAFINALSFGQNLFQVFQAGKAATESQHSDQSPQLDGDGNGVPGEAADQAEAEKRILFPVSMEGSPTVTPTPTFTPTPTATSTSTPPVTPTFTPTPSGIGDAYEDDNSCDKARLMAADSTSQQHSFHKPGDVDWIKVNVVAGATYQIDASVPETSLADVQLQLLARCGGSATPHDALGPGVRLRFKATENADYYLSFANYAPEDAGKDYIYQVSVRKLEDGPKPGVLVLVGGRLHVNDDLQPNIYEATNRMYRLFLHHGYTADRIFYLANDLNLDPDNNAQTVDVDALANRERLEYAITQWATDPKLGLGPDRAFTLYMMDHGDYDKFFLNGRNETVGPDDLDRWLKGLEAAAPGVKVNVMIDACLSGSFIDPEKSLSKSGRVVITSAANDSNAYVATNGTVFTNSFVQALDSDMSLFDAFAEAHAVGQSWPFVQNVWLDDNGNGIANDATDGRVAQQRGFAFAGSLSSGWDSEPPYVTAVNTPDKIENRRGQIRAKVLSTSKNLDVWAVIYEPNYTPPPRGDTLVTEKNLPTIRLEDTGGNGIFSGTYTGFDQMGLYRIVVYAVDDNELQSRPKQVSFTLGSQIFLPLVSR